MSGRKREGETMTAPGIAVIEAVFGSDLYRQSLRLREAILRAPLGLTLTEEELADDVTRQHFCAISHGLAVGTVSLKPLDEATLQLKQMAVAEARRRERIGALLLSHAEAWGQGAGFRLMVLHARIGADGFYAAFGYVAEGAPFEEHTLPHVKMFKFL
ncbi:MAG: GNAT family N-acetyltransferase [Methyloceanibacter sp.]